MRELLRLLRNIKISTSYLVTARNYNFCIKSSSVARKFCYQPISPHQNMSTNSNSLDSPATFFEGITDRYNGITINSTMEPHDQTTFENCLTNSLSAWRSNGIRGVWFIVDISHSHWVPVLAKHGFDFHHAVAGTVTMVTWLPSDEPNNIPRYAHTVVGVGAFVIREDTDEILVVRERFHTKPHWKLPGGYVERGEDLSVAAGREVLEETGISCQFESLVAGRHMHKAAFLCCDFYFIVHMKPMNTEIKMCTKELAACQWMKLDEYRSHPLVHETNRFFVDCYLDTKRKGLSIGATPLFHSVAKRDQIIYSLKENTNKEQEKSTPV